MPELPVAEPVPCTCDDAHVCEACDADMLQDDLDQQDWLLERQEQSDYAQDDYPFDGGTGDVPW